MKELWKLFAAFFKVGALSFGGGYTMLPIVQREATEKHGWTSSEEVIDYYAVAQCLPGLIAVNTAILVGYKARKKAGGLAAAIGIILPSLLVIMLIAAFLQNFLEVEMVKRAFWGLRAVVSALIAQVILDMRKTALPDGFSYVVYVAALLLSIFTATSAAAIAVGAVAVGIARGVLTANGQGTGDQ